MTSRRGLGLSSPRFLPVLKASLMTLSVRTDLHDSSLKHMQSKLRSNELMSSCERPPLTVSGPPRRCRWIRYRRGSRCRKTSSSERFLTQRPRPWQSAMLQSCVAVETLRMYGFITCSKWRRASKQESYSSVGCCVI